MSPVISLIQYRAGTAAQWTAINPILGNNEPGYESDTGRAKVGNGVTNWVGRPYGDALTILTSAKGVAGGVATLGADSKITPAQLNSGVANGLATLDATGKQPLAQTPFLVNGKYPHRSLVHNVQQVLTNAGYNVLNKWAPDPYAAGSDQGDSSGIVLNPATGVLTVSAAGLYDVSAIISFPYDAAKVGYRMAQVYLNTGASGASVAATCVPSGNMSVLDAVQLSRRLRLVVGDYLQVKVLQNWGQAMTLPQSDGTTNGWQVSYVGP